MQPSTFPAPSSATDSTASWRQLRSRIAAVRQRQRLKFFGTGALAAVAVFVAAFLGFSLADILFKFSTGARVAVLVATGAAVLFALIQFVLRPLTRMGTTVQSARAVEGAFPELEQQLSTALEFGGDKSKAERFASPVLVAALVNQAGARSAPLNFARTIRWRQMVVAFGAAFLLGALMAGYAASNRRLFAATWNRFVRPTADIPPPTLTEITKIEPGDGKYALESSVPIAVTLDGKLPETATLSVLIGDEKDGRWEDRPMDRGTDGVYRATLRRLLDSARYKIKANDAESREFNLRVFKTPEIAEFTVRVEHPAYTGKGTETFPLGVGEVRALKGSVIHVDMKANVELGAASAAFKSSRPAVTGTKDTEDKRKATLSFPVEKDDSYQLKIADEDGNPGSGALFTIKALKDRYPRVTIKKPEKDLMAFREQTVEVEIVADDDIGVKEVGIFHSMGLDEKQIMVKRMEPQPPHAEAKLVWELGSLNLKGGEVVSYYAYAIDNDTVTPGGPKMSKSDIHFLTIYDEEKYDSEKNPEKKKNPPTPPAIKALDKLIDAQKKILKDTFAQARQNDSLREKDESEQAKAREGEKSAAAKTAEGQKQLRSRVEDLLENAKKEMANADLPETKPKEGDPQPGHPPALGENELKHLETAIAKMQTAEGELRKPSAPTAVTPESEALRHLSETRRLMLSDKEGDPRFKMAMNKNSKKKQQQERDQQQQDQQQAKQELAEMPKMMEKQKELERELEELNERKRKPPQADPEQNAGEKQAQRELQKQAEDEAEKLAKEAEARARKLEELADRNQEMQPASDKMKEAADKLAQAQKELKQNNQQSSQNAQEKASQAQQETRESQRSLRNAMEKQARQELANLQKDAQDLAQRQQDLAQQMQQNQPQSGQKEQNGQKKEEQSAQQQGGKKPEQSGKPQQEGQPQSAQQSGKPQEGGKPEQSGKPESGQPQQGGQPQSAAQSGQPKEGSQQSGEPKDGSQSAQQSGQPKEGQQSGAPTPEQMRAMAGKQREMASDLKDINERAKNLADKANEQNLGGAKELENAQKQSGDGSAAGDSAQKAQEAMNAAKAEEAKREAQNAAKAMQKLASTLQDAKQKTDAADMKALGSAMKKAQNLAHEQADISKGLDDKNQSTQQLAGRQDQVGEAAKELAETASHLEALRQQGRNDVARGNLEQAAKQANEAASQMKQQNTPTAKAAAAQVEKSLAQAVADMERAAGKTLEDKAREAKNLAKSARENQEKADTAIQTVPDDKAAQPLNSQENAQRNDAVANENQAARDAQRLDFALEGLKELAKDVNPAAAEAANDARELTQKTELPRAMDKLGADMKRFGTPEKPNDPNAAKSPSDAAKKGEELARTLKAVDKGLDEYVSEARNSLEERLKATEEAARNAEKLAQALEKKADEQAKNKDAKETAKTEKKEGDPKEGKPSDSQSKNDSKSETASQGDGKSDAKNPQKSQQPNPNKKGDPSKEAKADDPTKSDPNRQNEQPNPQAQGENELADAKPEQLKQELKRQLDKLKPKLERLDTNAPEKTQLREAMAALEQQPNDKEGKENEAQQPGTPTASKKNMGGASIKRVSKALDQIAQGLLERRERLLRSRDVRPNEDEDAPKEYRSLVDRYYRALSEDVDEGRGAK